MKTNVDTMERATPVMIARAGAPAAPSSAARRRESAVLLGNG